MHDNSTTVAALCPGFLGAVLSAAPEVMTRRVKTSRRCTTNPYGDDPVTPPTLRYGEDDRTTMYERHLKEMGAYCMIVSQARDVTYLLWTRPCRIANFPWTNTCWIDFFFIFFSCCFFVEGHDYYDECDVMKLKCVNALATMFEMNLSRVYITKSFLVSQPGRSP
jgi:hypothetical protein